MRNTFDDRDLLTGTFDDREFGKSSFCDGADGCVHLPTDGILNAVADSKTGTVLSASAVGLVAFAKAS